VVGIGVTMSAANVVAGTLGLVLLRRKLNALDGRGIGGYLVLRTGIRVLLIAVLAGGVTAAGAWYVGPVEGQVANLAVVLVGGVVVLAVFVLLCRLMRVRELDDLVAPLLRRLPLPGRR
jgi:putative peptidoglycan lipid II flippase